MKGRERRSRTWRWSGQWSNRVPSRRSVSKWRVGWFVYEISTALVLSSLGCKPPVPTQPLGATSVVRSRFAARARYTLHLVHLASTRSLAHSFTRSAFKSIKREEECIGVVVGSALFLPRQGTERETERERGSEAIESRKDACLARRRRRRGSLTQESDGRRMQYWISTASLSARSTDLTTEEPREREREREREKVHSTSPLSTTVHKHTPVPRPPRRAAAAGHATGEATGCGRSIGSRGLAVQGGTALEERGRERERDAYP